MVNNATLLDLPCLQRMLGSADLRVEIFHVISFLLVYASWHWARCAAQVRCPTLFNEWHNFADNSRLLINLLKLGRPKPSSHQHVLRLHWLCAWGTRHTNAPQNCSQPALCQMCSQQYMHLLCITCVARAALWCGPDFIVGVTSAGGGPHA